MYKETVTMKTASQAHHTTAAIWFRFASPKFLLHCVPQKLHIAANVVKHKPAPKTGRLLKPIKTKNYKKLMTINCAGNILGQNVLKMSRRRNSV